MQAQEPGSKEMGLITADPQGAVQAMKSFQQLKESLLVADDLATIGGKAYIKRSGWRKIALAFNISTLVTKITRSQLGPDEWLIEVQAAAIAPNHRASEEVGACQSSELARMNMDPTIHNLETKAITRAINRAVSNLVGGGQISAEEVPQEAGKK